jgi:hypothetical protein
MELAVRHADVGLRLLDARVAGPPADDVDRLADVSLAARGLAPQVVEVEVDDAEALARSAPRVFDVGQALAGRVAEHVGVVRVRLAVRPGEPAHEDRAARRRDRDAPPTSVFVFSASSPISFFGHFTCAHWRLCTSPGGGSQPPLVPWPRTIADRRSFQRSLRNLAERPGTSGTPRNPAPR